MTVGLWGYTLVSPGQRLRRGCESVGHQSSLSLVRGLDISTQCVSVCVRKHVSGPPSLFPSSGNGTPGHRSTGVRMPVCVPFSVPPPGSRCLYVGVHGDSVSVSTRDTACVVWLTVAASVHTRDVPPGRGRSSVGIRVSLCRDSHKESGAPRSPWRSGRLSSRLNSVVHSLPRP